MWSIVGAIGGVLILVTGISPELSQSFSLIEFPDDVSIRLVMQIFSIFKNQHFSLQFKLILLTVLGCDLLAAFMIDRVLDFFLGKGSLKSIS